MYWDPYSTNLVVHILNAIRFFTRVTSDCLEFQGKRHEGRFKGVKYLPLRSTQKLILDLFEDKLFKYLSGLCVYSHAIYLVVVPCNTHVDLKPQYKAERKQSVSIRARGWALGLLQKRSSICYQCLVICIVALETDGVFLLFASLPIIIYKHLCSRHTQTKTMKTALRPEKCDERGGNVVSTYKNAVFKSVLRPYNVLTRFSLRLTRSH